MPNPIDVTKIAIRGTTQDHLDIEDILDDIIILKNGSCRLVIQTNAINFGLLSEREQEATIYAYAGLLNSLSFPLQIVVRSQKKDISSYLKLIEDTEGRETRPKIKAELQKYRQFVKDTVQKNEVLDKKFYLVVPMDALELGVNVKALTSGFSSKKKLPLEKSQILERAKVNLYPKRDHILSQLGRLGLKGRQLTTAELIQLFFETYNPETQGQQIITTGQYHPPLVQSVTKIEKVASPQLPPEAKPEQVSPGPPKEGLKINPSVGEPAKNPDSLQQQIDGLVKKAAT